jgi:hypothetical protein
VGFKHNERRRTTRVVTVVSLAGGCSPSDEGYGPVKGRLDVAGLLYRLDKGRSLIFLNQEDSVGRQRFSWAHELGHIVMGGQVPDQVSCRKSSHADKGLERSCDIIATELLMPREPFSAATNELGWSLASVNELAHHFQTSFEAAAIRLFELAKEPLLLSVWRLGDNPGQELRLKWVRSNDPAKALKERVRIKTKPNFTGLVSKAYQSSEIQLGPMEVLITTGGESRSESVPTEAVGVGRNTKRSVFVVHRLQSTNGS